MRTPIQKTFHTWRVLRNEGSGDYEMVVCISCEAEVPMPSNWLFNYERGYRKRLVCPNCGAPKMTRRIIVDDGNAFNGDVDPLEDNYDE